MRKQYNNMGLVIYILKKLGKIFFKKHFEQFGRTDQAEIWYDYALTYVELGKLFICRARQSHAFYSRKTCFWG